MKENSIENISAAKDEQIENQSGSFDRAWKTIKMMIDAEFKSVKVKGQEHLSEIPPDAKVIFTTTHLSDSDVPIALSVLGKDFKNIAVADSSTHHTFRENPMAYIGTKIAGEENFLPVQHTKEDDGKERGVLDTDDFIPMQNALEGGKSIVMAAYFKPHTGWELPQKGGYGAVYLSQITNAIIVPIAIHIKSKAEIGMGSNPLKTIFQRPEAEVEIGSPIIPEKMKNVSRFGEILGKRKKGEKLLQEEKKEFSKLSDEMRAQSDRVMEALASMLPEEKQGTWSKKKN